MKTKQEIEPSQTMNTKHTPGKWAWQKFGRQWCLTGQHGMRPIVLSVMKGELTSLVDGRLVALDPNHQDAQLIALAPTLLAQRDELREALELLLETMSDENGFIDATSDRIQLGALSFALTQARTALNNSKDP